MEFRVIFWNTWSDRQLSEAEARVVCERLGRLIDEHAPDVLGLNEVVMDQTTGVSRVLEYLQSRGYQTHFAAHGPDRPNMLVGSALASRRAPSEIREPVWGPDKTAARHGFSGYEVRAIDSDIPVGEDGRHVRVMVNYWAHLVPYNWRNHGVHVRAFHRHMAESGGQGPTIIGGDFNEFKHMPAIRQLGGVYHRATGTLLHPTWRWQGQRRRLLMANYDNILWSRSSDIQLQEFNILPRAPSDHAPLLARFVLPD